MGASSGKTMARSSWSREKVVGIQLAKIATAMIGYDELMGCTLEHCHISIIIDVLRGSSYRMTRVLFGPTH